MTSTRPYLIRAFYDWIVDNQCTPHIVVNAKVPNIQIPEEYVQDGQIVLNIALSAVQGLRLGEDAVEFKARFGGRVRAVWAPVTAVLAIYAKENGRGMVFPEEEDEPNPPSDQAEEGTTTTSTTTTNGKRSGRPPHLTVVK